MAVLQMPTTLSTTSPRALVLEDEALILMAIEAVLSDARYEVLTASTGPQALALLDAHTFDVAVLDIGLKSGSSIEIADALLKRAIPFVFSTGSSDSVPIEFAAIPIITKPFAEKDLISLVGSVLAPR